MVQTSNKQECFSYAVEIIDPSRSKPRTHSPDSHSSQIRVGYESERNPEARAPEPESADIEQIVAYAVSMRTKNAFLVYPSLVTRDFDLRVPPSAPTVHVKGLVFDIGKDPEKAGSEFTNRLLADVR